MQQGLSTLPSNPEAERSVLGALLQDPSVMHYASVLAAEDFHSPANREVFAALTSVAGSGVSPDLVTVDDELIKRGTLDGVGGTAYLVQLIQQVPTTASTQSYVQIVKDYANRRKAIATLGDGVEGIMEGLRPLDEILLDIINDARKITTTRHRWVDMMQVLLSTNDMVERRMQGHEKRIRTGIADLDRYFFGLVPGELTVIGARPSVGKSAFGVSIATRASLDGFSAGVFSLEMAPEQYGMRILASISGVSLSQIRDGTMTDEEYTLYVQAMGPASAIDIRYAFDAYTIEGISAMAQQMVDQTGIDLLIIDHLHLMHSTKGHKSEYERLSYVTQSLKALALRLNIPIVLLAQLSRAATSRADKRPVSTDLRGSGSIEQDADNVVLLHRFEADNEVGLTPEDATLMRSLEQSGGQLMLMRVLKQRQGETFDCNTAFFPVRMRFSGIA